MNTSKLSKNFTYAKKAFYALTITCFFHPSLHADEGEMADARRPMSDRQFQMNYCGGLDDRLSQAKSEFLSACGKASIGSSVEACSEVIEKCSEKNKRSEKDEDCINFASGEKSLEAARERKKDAGAKIEKVAEKIDELRTENEDLEQAAIELADRKRRAEEALANAMAQTASAKTAALEKANADRRSLELQIESTQDKIQDESLKLRKFVLDNDIKCREEANKRKDSYVAVFRRLKAQGNESRFSQATLLKYHGMSVNDIAAMRADRFLAKCSSVTLTGKRGTRVTDFGAQYKLQRDIIMANQKRLKREMIRYEEAKSIVEDIKRATLRQLDEENARNIAAHQRLVLQISKEALILDENLRKLNQRQLGKQMELNFARVSQVQAQYHEDKVYASSQKGSEDQRDHFLAAIKGLSDYNAALERRVGDNKICELSQRTRDLARERGIEVPEILEAVVSVEDGRAPAAETE